MKKLLVLLTAFTFIIACNNNKNNKNQNNREKDDYGNMGNKGNKDNQDNRENRNDDNNNNLSSGNWSGSDENKWMDDCATPLIGTVGEVKAKNYCNCVLDRLKEIYSSYDEMNIKGTEEIGEELGMKCVKELGVGE